MMCKRIYTALVLVVFITLLTADAAAGHRLYIDVTEVRTQVEIEIEVYYGDGKPARNSDVTVYNPDDEVILTGKTDDDGMFKFILNDTMGLENITVVVEQVGHRAEAEIDIIGGDFSADTRVGDGMPIYANIIAGFGYLLGIAGFAALYQARKHKRGGMQEK
jgi:nickel transport protein